MSISIDRHTRCYHGVQRIYRNAMVAHLRMRLTAKYPDTWLDELRRPLAKEWDTLVESVRRVGASGAVEAHASDEFDYIGVPQFIPLIEAHFDLLFPTDAGLEKAEKTQLRSSVLRWTKQVKDVRDPISHPPTEDLSFPDLYGTLDAARRVLERVDAPAAARIAELMSQAVGSQASRATTAEASTGPLEGNLPSRGRVAADFVGRRHELDELRSWLFDAASRSWALTGEGGKGKTALAFEFVAAARQEAPRPLESILWMSAKQREFREGAVAEITPDFTDLESALDRILREYNWSEALGWELAAKKLTVLELLAKFPALIVLDDIDSAEEVLQFFEVDLSRTPCKVLLTSRRLPFGWTKSSTQIRGLSGPEADEFIDSRLDRMGVTRAAFGPAERERLLQVTEGSPLYIEDLLRLVSVGVSPRDAMHRWSRASGEAARRFALEHEFSLLSLAARKVLITCALNPAPPSVPEVIEITRLTQEDAEAAIADLQRLYLVPAPELAEGVPRFALNTNVQTLVRSVTANTPVHREVYGAIQQLSDEFVTSQRQRDEVSAYIRQAIVLQRQGDQDGAERVLDRGLESYPNHADLLGQLGWLYTRWAPIPRRAEARLHFVRSSEMHCKRPEMYYHWSEVENHLGNLGEALAVVDRGLERVPESIDLRQRLGFARSRLAGQLQRENAPSRAVTELTLSNQAYEETLRLSAIASDRRNAAVRSKCYEGLVFNFTRIGEDEKVGETLRRWLAEAPGDVYALQERDKFLARRPEWRQFLSADST